MSFLGLSAEDYVEESTAWVWPCNVQAVNLFVFLSTQWDVGPNGAYALNYDRMWSKMDRMGLTKEAYAALEEDMRILEDAALEQMHKNQE